MNFAYRNIGILAAAVLTVAHFAGSLAWAQKPPVRIKTEGKVLAVSPGVIQMHSPKDGNLMVKIPEDRKVVSVTGKLHPSQLAAGMIVRFVGKMQGAAMADPVATITVYRPLEGYQPSLLADDPEAVVVTGPVVSNKNGKLIVKAGARTVSATMTDDAAVNIETGDYSIARAGDPIIVGGYKSTNGNVSAREVKITLTIPAPGEGTKKKKK